MTDAQREAAVKIVDSLHGYTCEHSPSPDAHRADYDEVERILSEFVVLHRDDVTEETDVRRYGERWRKQRRLVTRWEPITEDTP